MKNLNIIITMGGLGSRFQKAGYKVPKYQIEAKGKTLFEWSLESLLDYNDHAEKYVFAVKKEDCAESFIKENCKKYGIEHIELLELEKLTDGQATTAWMALGLCDKSLPVLIYNIDTYVEPYSMLYQDLRGDGHIPCFHAEGTHWSFARLDENGNVIEVKEKERISDNCTLGAYYFASGELYENIYKEFYLQNKDSGLKEKYIAPLYNFMIQKGMKVTISMVEAQKVHVLGTPEELDEFIRNR